MREAAWRRNLAPVLIFFALALVPFLAKLGPESFILSLMSRVLILALAAMSLDLLVGYAGLVSFGHAAFIGIGAYGVAIMADAGVTDIVMQAGAAVAVAVLFASLTGIVVLRTRAVAFIMITLAFGQMLYFLATSLAAYGGDDGMTLSRRSTLLGSSILRKDDMFYGACLTVLVAAYAMLRGVTASRFGRVLAGARDNEVRMEAVGFAPARFRLVAYVIAGIGATLAGVLSANQSEFVSPQVMSWQRSGDLIFMVVLGGQGTLHGAILGAAAFLLVEEVLSHYTEHWRIVFGPLLILAVIFGRGGLVALPGLLGQLGRRGATR